MPKRKLCVSILIGSLVGGLIAMTDPKVRKYTKEKVSDLSTKSAQFIKNPSDTIQKVITTFDEVTETLEKGTNRVVETLETVDQSLQKFTDK